MFAALDVLGIGSCLLTSLSYQRPRAWRPTAPLEQVDRSLIARCDTIAPEQEAVVGGPKQNNSGERGNSIGFCNEQQVRLLSPRSRDSLEAKEL